MSKTLIHNIGTILSGAFENPILAGDTVCTDGDKIVFIGDRADAPALDYTLDIDANGLTLCPGIIDAHAHPPLANYLEAYKAYDWVDNYAGAGITSLVSLGGHNFAGAAGDVVSAKAQAIYSKYYWDHNHPSFAKIHAGTVMLQHGMTDSDFAELAAQGVHVVGEIGMSDVKDVEEAARLVAMAKAHGFVTTLHCAAPCTADGVAYTYEEIERIAPDVLERVAQQRGVADPLQARNMARLAGGDLLELGHLVAGESDAMRKEHFDLFCSLMRLSYNDRHLELVAWAEDAAQLTREQQRAFLRDAARLLRESFMLHAGIREVSYLWGEELAFCSKFAPFVGPRNIEPLIAEIESAAAQIAQNGNPTIVFTHFALSVSKMIKHL